MATHLNDTVAELVEFIDRAKMALTEAGRPELAARAHVRVLADGTVLLSFAEDDRRLGTPSSPDVDKFLSIDPVFEKAGN